MKKTKVPTTNYQSQIPKIIGIGGTNASGKDSLAAYLSKKYDYLFVSAGDLVREEAMKRCGNILRPTLQTVGNAMRQEQGAGVVILMAYKKFIKSGKKGLVIGSIRTGGEVEELKRLGGILLFIDADVKTRYERIKARQRDDDFISFEEFKKQQDFEWHQSDNPAEYSISSVKNAADYGIQNDSDLAAFYNKAEQVLRITDKKLDKIV